MKKVFVVFTALSLLLTAFAATPIMAKAIPDAIWSHGELYGVTVTPKDVPMEGPFDVLYNFADSGLNGQRSVSESAPGDQDYNGGRWEVIPVTFTALGMSIHDPDGDGMVNFELTSAEQLLHHVGLGHLTLGAPARYFVCPLHPQK